MKPKPADKWLSSLKAPRGKSVFVGAGPYTYVTNGFVILATAQPNAPLPANDTARVVTASRNAAVTGSVTGLRAAVRPLKLFAAEDADALTITVNGRLDVTTESYPGSASSYIDGTDYTHTGPDATIRVSYKYLLQALDGLPDTVTYRIYRSDRGPSHLGLAATVDGTLREAIIAGMRPA